ncbi:MAG: hypothetical protein LUC33_06995, partial [Prevotellaceae bacterium]|nr:hypothetical protein [Prevotellaceae bacterium]
MKKLHFLFILFALCSLGAKADETTVDVADITSYKVASISSTAATSITAGSWYLLEQDREGQNHNGNWTPALDNGEGETITRASSADVLEEGTFGGYAAKYLVRFVETGTTSTENTSSTVYNIQFATGNYFKSNATSEYSGAGVTTVADASEATSWNVYTIGSNEGHFGINQYDMSYDLNNNGIGGDVVSWESGEITSTGGNNDWELFEVTLEAMTEDDMAQYETELAPTNLLTLIREADALYESNNDWTYSTDDKLITDETQLSSPYTATNESTGKISALIDGDSSTYWHSDWSQGVDDDVHYFQVELSEDLEGADLIAYIQRRAGTNSDQIIKMGVKNATNVDDEEYTDDEVIAILDYPFTTAGEKLTDHFYLPSGVTKLRFYEEEKQSSSTAGCFNLAEFQLYPATVSDDCANSTHPKTAAAFSEAIKTASELYTAYATEDCAITTDDVATLQAAIDAYKIAIE